MRRILGNTAQSVRGICGEADHDLSTNDWQGLLDAVAHNADQDFSLERRRARAVSFLVKMAHMRLATLVGA
ncbi:MAG: hypothetical protein IPH35_06295 [Rhodoferax sp.]|nr:hypothetical protein [Rhodoferax sp.]